MIKKTELELYYDSLFKNCKSSFIACINEPENNELEVEIGSSLNSLICENESIRFHFKHKLYGEAVNEIQIRLLDKNQNQVGHYQYVQNLKGDAIDDFLVLY